MILRRYSDISVAHSLVIDNYNANIDHLALIEKLTPATYYRVFSRSRSDNGVYGERYFSDMESAVKYWSEIMAYKPFIF